MLVGRYDGTDAKASRNLQELIALMEAISVGGVPPQYNRLFQYLLVGIVPRSVL
jgi:hypothetical protein